MAWLIPLMLCFLFLSAICELLMIYGFIKVKQLRKHPGSFIMIQCVCQLFIELHWLTILSVVKSSLSNLECRIIGALVFYVYNTAWTYMVFLSLEVYYKINKPSLLNTSSRVKKYHFITLFTSIVPTLYICFTPQNGHSRIGTCAIQEYTPYQLLWGIHVIIQMPICLALLTLAVFSSRMKNKMMKRGVKYHIFVVIAFCVTLAPAELYDSLDWGETRMHSSLEENWIVCFCILLGASSGLVIFVIRFLQKDLLKMLLSAIICKKSETFSNLSDFSVKLIPYQQLFSCVDHDMFIVNTLCGLVHVFSDADTNSVSKTDRMFSFTSQISRSKCKIIQYNYLYFSKSLETDYISSTHMLESFLINENLKAIESNFQFIDSNEFAFLTYDRRFHIKGLSTEELFELNSVSKEYSQRQISANSYLTSIYGIFSVVTKEGLGFNFMVYENLGFEFLDPQEVLMVGDRMVALNKHESIQEAKELGRIKLNSLQLKKVINGIKADVKIFERFEKMRCYLKIIYEKKQGTFLRSKRKVIFFNEGVGYITVFFRISNPTDSLRTIKETTKSFSDALRKIFYDE